MHPPARLHDLPPPPPGRTGWPWTEASPAVAEGEPGCAPFPVITIVTPSYNQAPFLEETIRSVLLQNYANLEYMIIDGGSTDGSVEIIKKYASWCDYWVSEPDRGQSHAINKGLARAKGDLLGWLNSDDYFLPNALMNLAALARRHPEGAAWVGGCYDVDKHGGTLRFHAPRADSKAALADWWFDGYFCQPACLFNRDFFNRIGGLNEALYFLLDVEYWLRLVEVGSFFTIGTPVAASRLHEEAKTFQNPAMREVEHIAVNVAFGEREIARKRLLRFAGEEAAAMRLGMKPSEILHLLADRLYRDARKLFGKFSLACGQTKRERGQGHTPF